MEARQLISQFINPWMPCPPSSPALPPLVPIALSLSGLRFVGRVTVRPSCLPPVLSRLLHCFNILSPNKAIELSCNSPSEFLLYTAFIIPLIPGTVDNPLDIHCLYRLFRVLFIHRRPVGSPHTSLRSAIAPDSALPFGLTAKTAPP